MCDDVDECVGALDECGVCNGPGAVFECGCTELPEGDCDCDGSQQDALGECGGGCFADADGDGICDDEDDCVGSLDALGVCNGDCEADADGNGICDDEEGGDVFGCTIEQACNYKQPQLRSDRGRWVVRFHLEQAATTLKRRRWVAMHGRHGLQLRP